MAKSFFASLGDTCPKCKGSGVLPTRHPDEQVLTCPTCDGDGVVKVEVTKIDHVEMPCDNPQCRHGKVTQEILTEDGRLISGEVECPICLGLTRIVKDITRTYEEVQECPTCKAAGNITMEVLRKRGGQVLCDLCHGLGFIPKKGRVALLAFAVGMIVLMPIPSFIIILLAFMGFGVGRSLKRKKGDGSKAVKRVKRDKKGQQ